MLKLYREDGGNGQIEVTVFGCHYCENGTVQNDGADCYSPGCPTIQ